MTGWKQYLVAAPSWLAAFGMPAALLAADWKEIAVDDDGTRYSIDESATRRDGPRVQLRMRTEFAKPRDAASVDGPVLGSLDQLVLDCGSERFALQSRTYRTADLREVAVISHSRDELVFRPAAPGTISADLVRHGCRLP